MGKQCHFCDRKHWTNIHLACGDDTEGICNICSFLILLHKKHNTQEYQENKCYKCNQPFEIKIIDFDLLEKEFIENISEDYFKWSGRSKWNPE